MRKRKRRRVREAERERERERERETENEAIIGVICYQLSADRKSKKIWVCIDNFPQAEKASTYKAQKQCAIHNVLTLAY